jgi:hypothetical protein
LSLRFEIEFPNRKVFAIGGAPLCSDDKMRELAPELQACLEKDSDDLSELEEKCFRIVEFYNPNISRDDFVVDVYCLTEIMKIWSGSKVDEEKKTI